MTFMRAGRVFVGAVLISGLLFGPASALAEEVSPGDRGCVVTLGPAAVTGYSPESCSYVAGGPGGYTGALVTSEPARGTDSFVIRIYVNDTLVVERQTMGIVNAPAGTFPAEAGDQVRLEVAILTECFFPPFGLCGLPDNGTATVAIGDFPSQ